MKKSNYNKSWFIGWDNQGNPHLTASHFSPGYTRGHFTTKQEAIDAEANRLGREETTTKAKIQALLKLTEVNLNNETN